MKYLVQEWIYRGKPHPVEKHEQEFQIKAEANAYFEEREAHLRATAAREHIFPSFVRMFERAPVRCLRIIDLCS